MDDSNIDSLMEAYNGLSTFADVNPALNRIALNRNIHAVIFSNGTQNMVSTSILRSPDLAPHSSVFRDLITVDEIQRYKPTRTSYQHLAEKVGKKASQMNEIWLVSGNPFDIIGARSMGMHAIWIDRARKGWQDAAAPELHPTAIIHSLERLVDEIGIKGRSE